MRPEQLYHSIQNELRIKTGNTLFLREKERKNCCIFVPPENITNQRNRKYPNREKCHARPQTTAGLLHCNASGYRAGCSQINIGG